MKGRSSDAWYPFWIDKWLLGSTRNELIIRDEKENYVEDLRGIFVDLMSLAYKDDGFIRANESVPYPIRQLAGLLTVPVEKLEQVIKICMDKGKLRLMPDGTLYLINREKYELSKRTIQRKNKALSEESKDVSLFDDSMAQNSDTREEKRRVEKIRLNKNTATAIPPKQSDGPSKQSSGLSEEFDLFWDAYPRKVRRDVAFEAFKALRKKVSLKEIADALNGYNAHLAIKKRKSREEKLDPDYILFPPTFLRKNRWKDYIGVVDKPTL